MPCSASTAWWEITLTPLEIIKSYRAELKKQTGVNAVIIPSEMDSAKFLVSLSMLPHPAVLDNGRVRLRLRGTVQAEIAASDKAINECLERSLNLARFFGDAQGYPLTDGKYAMAYHTALREDDELFADLSDEKGYVYAESWLIQLEFDETILSKEK